MLFEDCQWLGIKNLHLMYNGHSAFSVVIFLLFTFLSDECLGDASVWALLKLLMSVVMAGL